MSYKNVSKNETRHLYFQYSELTFNIFYAILLNFLKVNNQLIPQTQQNGKIIYIYVFWSHPFCRHLSIFYGCPLFKPGFTLEIYFQVHLKAKGISISIIFMVPSTFTMYFFLKKPRYREKQNIQKGHYDL